jgi:uncharacterized protein YabN with tetrapyrrole methylase and pyrophosphatase domain
MANNGNLITFAQRTESEVREMNRKGGINSGITRRKNAEENRKIREIVNAILKSKIVNEYGDETTRIVNMAQKYVSNVDSTLNNGETKPFEAMVELVEGKSVQPVEMESNVSVTAATMTNEELLKLSGSFDPDDFDDRDDSEPDS